MTLKMLIYGCSNKVRQELASLNQNNQHQYHLVNVIQLKVCNAVKMTNVQLQWSTVDKNAI